MFSLTIMIVSVAFLYFFQIQVIKYSNLTLYSNEYIVSIFLFLVVFAVYLSATIDLLVSLFLRTSACSSINHNFIRGIIKENTILLNFVLISAFISILTNFTVLSNSLENLQDKSEYLQFKSKILLYLLSESVVFFPAFTAFLFVLFIGDIIISFLNFKLYVEHFADRINKSNQDFEVIEMLNRVHRIRSDGIQQEANDIIKVLSDGRDFLTSDILRANFTDRETELILNRVDPNFDDIITKEEFEIFLRGTIQERKQIIDGLTEKNNTLSKLKNWFLIIKVALASMCFFALIGKGEEVKKYAVFMASIFVGTGYLFSSTFADLFKSFIFILFIRPYEIGDAVKIDDKVLVVEEINLNNTIFKEKSICLEMPNKSISSKNIYNFRKSKVEEVNYCFKFNITDWLKKQEILKIHLKRIVRQNPVVFKRECKIEKFKLLSSDLIEVQIVVFYRNRFQDIEALQENKDEFLINFHNILSTISLKIQ